MVTIEYTFFNKLWRDWRTVAERYETAEEAKEALKMVVEYNRVRWAAIDGVEVVSKEVGAK